MGTFEFLKDYPPEYMAIKTPSVNIYYFRNFLNNKVLFIIILDCIHRRKWDR